MTETTTETTSRVGWTAEQRANLMTDAREMLRQARRARDQRIATRESFVLQAQNATIAGDSELAYHKTEIVNRLSDELSVIGGDIAWALGRLADAGYTIRPTAHGAVVEWDNPKV